MNEERISRLEQENQQRAVEHARLSTSVEHLSESVRELAEKLGEFRDTMNKGRGALIVIVSASTLLGGAVSAIISKWASS